ncbi:unnamed protein product, partial [Iphiclides podalirius]
MLGAVLALTALATLIIKDANSLKIGEFAIEGLLDSMQRKLLTDREMKHSNIYIIPVNKNEKNVKYVNKLIDDIEYWKSNDDWSRKSSDYNEFKDLENYSKFYLVLNNLLNKEDSNSIKKLISKLLASKRVKTKNEQRKHLYKGFAIKHNLLPNHRRRDSNEYASYEQKRSNNRNKEFIGGRTGIPYAGNRHVYEKGYK